MLGRRPRRLLIIHFVISVVRRVILAFNDLRLVSGVTVGRIVISSAGSGAVVTVPCE